MVRPYVDRNARQAVRMTSGGNCETGTITDAGLRYLLAVYAKTLVYSEQRWKKLRTELIQKASTGTWSEG